MMHDVGRFGVEPPKPKLCLPTYGWWRGSTNQPFHFYTRKQLLL